MLSVEYCSSEYAFRSRDRSFFTESGKSFAANGPVNGRFECRVTLTLAGFVRPISERDREKSSSVSPGNPTMKSVAMLMPEYRLRNAATISSNSCTVYPGPSVRVYCQIQTGPGGVRT